MEIDLQSQHSQHTAPHITIFATEMVQFTDHSLFGGNNAHADRLDPYWKLDKGNQYDKQYDKQTLLGILESKNYSCASITSQARVQEL